MPRPRTLIILLFAIVGIILFARSTSSTDKTFYDNTVEKLHLKQDAERQHKMGTAAVKDSKLREVANQVKAEVEEAADARRKKGDEASEDSHHKHTTHDKEPVKAKDGQKVMGGVDDAQVKENKPHEVGSSRGKWTADDAKGEDATPEKTQQDKKMDYVLTDILKRSPIIIFSKTYCPFSMKAKSVFSKYKITPAPFIVEIDRHELGSELQDKLQETTGRRTVPNILINGKSIGGGDDVQALHDRGELLDKIKTMGGKRIVEAHLRDH